MKERRPFKEVEAHRIKVLKEFEALPPDAPKREWLLKQGLADTSHFYAWRKKYLAKQAAKPSEGELVTGGKHYSAEARQRIREASKRRWEQFHAKRAGRPLKSQCRFNEASREEKQQLLNEYDGLSQKAKQEWRVRNLGAANPHNGILSYYRKQFAKEAKPSVALVVHDAPKRDEAALLAEYDALPPGVRGSKGDWLKARGLSYGIIHNMRGRVARNGHSQPPVFANVLPHAAPAPVVTLGDAIDAMQVRIDIYNEVLGHFRNMLRGNR